VNAYWRWLQCGLYGLVLGLGVLGLASDRAWAQAGADVPVRQIAVVFQDVPMLSFSVRDFVDSEVVRKLQSGLPQTITTRVYVYADRGREPVGVTALSCRVVYDLWEGVYRIERQTETSDKTLTARSVDGVVAQCLSFQSYAFGAPAAFQKLRGSSLYFGVVTELNPLSADAIQRIRRWLARPTGSELNGNAFFGSFVSIFVDRKLGAADKQLTFRSNLYVVPP
jgi:hypothetical protein